MSDHTYPYVEYGLGVAMTPQPVMRRYYLSRWQHFLIAIGLRKEPDLYVELGLEKAVQRAKDAMALQMLTTPFSTYEFKPTSVDLGQ